MDPGPTCTYLLPQKMCDQAGVHLQYLPPYSPDLNPIEESFAELKAFIKRNWQRQADAPQSGVPEPSFSAFLERCVMMVGGRQSSARGHFRHAGIAVEEKK